MRTWLQRNLEYRKRKKKKTDRLKSRLKWQHVSFTWNLKELSISYKVGEVGMAIV